MEVSKGSEYIHTPALRSLVWAYVPTDEKEKVARNKMLEFLENTKKFPWDRENFSDGHITASAWVVDEENRRVLLVHHKKFHVWVQPGGHIDKGEDVFSATLRELKEETGVSGAHEPKVFDVDTHSISARSGEPAHIHYDIRVLVRVKSSTAHCVPPGEGEARWVDLDSVSKFTKDESILRMVQKTKALSL